MMEEKEERRREREKREGRRARQDEEGPFLEDAMDPLDDDIIGY